MVWRVWSFVAGLPVGALGVLVFVTEPSLGLIEAGALICGALLALVVALVGRVRDDDPARGAHLALASSVGWVALPACGIELLDLAPGAPWLFAATGLLLGVSLGVAARIRAPLRVRSVLGWTIALPVTATLGVLLVSAAIAQLGARQPSRSEALSAAVYDFDAQIETRALPFCSQELEHARVVLERGAHPSLSRDGGFLWFDAQIEDGTRQVHRLERASGLVECWTCGQEGNNRRPNPGPMGAMLVFDSDRNATWHHPSNTDVYWMGARGPTPSRNARRLTHHLGPDDHALLGPSSRVVVWSRRESGRFFVASASVRSGHGSALLRDPGVMHAGGAAWTAPLAWSPDARTMVVVRGNPFQPLEAIALDPATAEEFRLGPDLPSSAVGAFSSDGGWIAIPGSQRGHVAGLLPGAFGFLLGSLKAAIGSSAPRFRSTRLATGPAHGPLQDIALGDEADWGEPTGAALAPDGRSVVIGQRGRRGGRVEERLLELILRCAAPASA